MKPDIALLCVGLIRPFVWATGSYLATTYKNWPAAIGTFLCALVSIPTAFIYAHYRVPLWASNFSGYMGTPATMFLVSGIFYSARNISDFRQRIEEWKHSVEDG